MKLMCLCVYGFVQLSYTGYWAQASLSGRNISADMSSRYCKKTKKNYIGLIKKKIKTTCSVCGCLILTLLNSVWLQSFYVLYV